MHDSSQRMSLNCRTFPESLSWLDFHGPFSWQTLTNLLQSPPNMADVFSRNSGHTELLRWQLISLERLIGLWRMTALAVKLLKAHTIFIGLPPPLPHDVCSLSHSLSLSPSFFPSEVEDWARELLCHVTVRGGGGLDYRTGPVFSMGWSGSVEPRLSFRIAG